MPIYTPTTMPTCQPNCQNMPSPPHLPCHATRNANHAMPTCQPNCKNMPSAMPCHSRFTHRNHACHTNHLPHHIYNNLYKLPSSLKQLDVIALSPAQDCDRGCSRITGLSSPSKRPQAQSPSHSQSHLRSHSPSHSRLHTQLHSQSHSPPRHHQHCYTSPNNLRGCSMITRHSSLSKWPQAQSPSHSQSHSQLHSPSHSRSHSCSHSPPHHHQHCYTSPNNLRGHLKITVHSSLSKWP